MQGDTKVPSGIDAMVLIDAKTNPKIARGVLMGSVFSNSVTIDFDWIPSHEFENEEDFYMSIGKLHTDGKMVRRIVTKIHDYFESSLVWLGADPYAKAIDNEGDLVNIDVSNVYEYTRTSFSKKHKIDLDKIEDEEDKDEKNLKIDFAMDKNVLSLRQNLSNNENTEEMDKFWVAFLAAFGASLNLKAEDKLDTFSQEKIDEIIGKLQLSNPEENKFSTVGKSVQEQVLKFVQASKPEVTEVNMTEFMATHTFIAKEELENHKTALESYKADATIGQNYLKSRKDEAIRLYKTSVDAPDENVIKLFNEADNSAIDGLLAQYTKKATEKFSGKCTSCGSTDFTFQSTFTKDEEGATETSQGTFTAQDFREQYGSRPLFNNENK